MDETICNWSAVMFYGRSDYEELGRGVEALIYDLQHDHYTVPPVLFHHRSRLQCGYAVSVLLHALHSLGYH
eukprot:scaffold47462_cov61-Cyclotella_meneghiniana.AAC.3